MSPAPLEEYLRTAGDDRLDWRTFLTIESLGALARAGNSPAVKILQDYIAFGPKWDAALRELAALPGTSATEGLADIICARFATGAEMQASAVYGIFGEPPLDALWQSWQQTHPCIGRLLDEARAGERAAVGPVPPGYESLPVDELLRLATAGNHRQIEKALRARLQPSDVETYAAAFATDNLFAWWIALACLAAMDRAAPFYDRVLAWLVPYFEGATPGAVRGPKIGAVTRMLQSLPAESTLPLGRRWFDSPVWHLQHAGEGILKAHAILDDIPRLRGALAAALDSARPENTDVYRVCGALEILARFPGIGPLPEVEAAFVRSGYSYARRRAAEAMRANAPAWFAETYAYECLWDCEEPTRELGCESVSLSLPGARERLAALAGDARESDSLRQAGAARLASAP